MNSEGEHGEVPKLPIEVALQKEGNGYFLVIVQDACAGTLYRYRLDDDTQLYPDPSLSLSTPGSARTIASD